MSIRDIYLLSHHVHHIALLVAVYGRIISVSQEDNARKSVADVELILDNFMWTSDRINWGGLMFIWSATFNGIIEIYYRSSQLKNVHFFYSRVRTDESSQFERNGTELPINLSLFCELT